MKKPVKILLFGAAGGILVVGGLLAWAASDSFFRSQVLERASTALGTPVRAGGVDWAPTSGLQLDQLTIGEGESKLLTADKVKLSWNLMPLLSKRLEVNEVTLSQAEIFIALDAEGKPKNLPKPQAAADDKAKNDDAPKKDSAPSSPPNFCIKAVKLDRCKLTITRDGANGQAGSSLTVKDFSLDLPLLSPGQDFHLAIAAALSSDGQGLGLKLEKCGLKINGGLSADLKPIGIKIEGELSGMSTTGKGMPDLTGRRFVCTGGVDFKDGKLDLGKDGLLFKEELRGVSGASLLLAGSLDTVKKEGEIRCEIRKVGASLLGLAAPFVSSSKGWQMWQKSLQDVGAPAGFGETDISYTGKIVLAGAAPLQAKGEFVLDNLPVVIGKAGRLQASAASVHFNHDLSFNQAAKSLELRTLGASVSVGNQELVNLDMPKPCGLDLASGRLTGDGARIALEVKNFDLGLVAPLAESKDFSLKTGRVTLLAVIAAAADGKIETSLKSSFLGLSFIAAGESVKDLSLRAELKASLSPDLSLDAPLISSEGTLAGQPIFKFSAHATKNAAGLVDLDIDKFQLEHALTNLLPAKIRNEIAIENFNLALEDAGATFDSKTSDATFKGVLVTKRCTVMKTDLPAVTLSHFLFVDASRSGLGAISLKQLILGVETRQGLDSLFSCRLKGSAEIPADAFHSSGFKTDKVSADFLLENLAVQPVVRNFLPTENLQKPRFANLNFSLPKLSIAVKNGVAGIHGGFASKRLIVRNPQGEDRVFANTSSDFTARFNVAEKHFFLDAFKLSFTPSSEITPLLISAKADVNVGDLAAAGNRVDVEFPAELELAPWVELMQSMLPPQTEKKDTLAQAPAKAAAPATSVAVNEPAKPLNCAFTFKAPRILYKRQGLEQIALDAALNGDEVNLQNFSFASEGKPFKISALLHKGARKSLNLKADGSIDLSLAQAGLKAIGKELDLAGVIQLNGINITAAGKDNDELTQSLAAAGKILVKVDRLQGEVAPGTRFNGLESMNLEVSFSGQAGSASAEGYFAPGHVKISNPAVKPLDLDGRIDFKANVLSNGVIDLVRCDGKISLAETVKALVFKVNGRLDPSFKTTSVVKLVMPETFNLRPLMDLQVKKTSAEGPATPAPESTPAPLPGPAAPAKDLPPFRFTASIAGMPDIKLEKLELDLETKGHDIHLIRYTHAGTKRPLSASGLITLGEVMSFKDLKLDGPLDFGIANSFINHGKKTSIRGVFDITQTSALSGSGKTPYELLNSMKGDLKGSLIEPLELVGYTNLPTLIPKLKFTGVDFAVEMLTDLDPAHMVFESGGFDISFNEGTMTINQLGLKGKSIMYDTRGTVVAQNNQWLIDITPNPGYRSSAKMNTALDVARAAGQIGSLFGNDDIKKGMDKLDKFNLDDVFALSEKTGMRHLITPFVFKHNYDASLPMDQLISQINSDSLDSLGKVIYQSWSDVSARKAARKQAGKATKPAGEEVNPAAKTDEVTPAKKEEPAEEKSDVEQIIDLFGKKKKKPAPAPAPAPAPEPAPVPKDEPPPVKKEEPVQEKSDVEQIIDLFGKKKKKK